MPRNFSIGFYSVILIAKLLFCVLASNQSASVDCPVGDVYCQRDKVGFEAIVRLFSQIDDDSDGSLDRTESDEYIREELKYEDDFDRQARFHGSDDHISVEDLWHLWVQSAVYNWTTDDAVDWLATDAELPQYADTFISHNVNGTLLPRLASNLTFASLVLGIKNVVHKQKLALKATDLVLFGPPKKSHSRFKDLIIVVLITVCIGGFWLIIMQSHRSKASMNKLMQDLENLQRSEDQLMSMQSKLETAEKMHMSVVEEKNSIEQKLKAEVEVLQAKSEAERFYESGDEKVHIRNLEEEVIELRKALVESENHRHTAPLGELQQWLQLTYEVESKYYEGKKEAAHLELQNAKDMCEKIRKRRAGFLGSLRIAHTTSMDDTDHSIMAAKSALADVQSLMEERSKRWRQIEKICGFDIINNPGFQHLDAMLHGRSNILGFTGLDESADDVAPRGLAARSMLPSMPRVASAVAMSERQDNELRVWPNLMMAGLQLTRFGLGLTDPRLGAMYPYPINPMEPVDRRMLAPPTSSISKAFSSSAVNRVVNVQKAVQGFVDSTKNLASSAGDGERAPHVDTNGHSHNANSDTMQSAPANGAVKFHLSSSRSTLDNIDNSPPMINQPLAVTASLNNAALKMSKTIPVEGTSQQHLPAAAMLKSQSTGQVLGVGSRAINASASSNPLAGQTTAAGKMNQQDSVVHNRAPPIQRQGIVTESMDDASQGHKQMAVDGGNVGNGSNGKDSVESASVASSVVDDKGKKKKKTNIVTKIFRKPSKTKVS